MDTITTIQSLLTCNGSAQLVTVALMPNEMHLIAAAPDLLAACKAQHGVIDRLMAMLIVHMPDFRPSRSIAWPVLIQANAAIAKAEGRS